MEKNTKCNKRTLLKTLLCLVLLQVPKCFVLVQIFFARPKIYLHIVAVTNILCQTKRWFAFSKIDFCAGTKGFEEALNAVKFLGWFKKFGPPQNILGLVKGQGIRVPISLSFFIFGNPNLTYVLLKRLLSKTRDLAVHSNCAGFGRNIMICTIATSIFRSPASWPNWRVT